MGVSVKQGVLLWGFSKEGSIVLGPSWRPLIFGNSEMALITGTWQVV